MKVQYPQGLMGNAFRYIEDYIARNYNNEFKKRITDDSVPTEASVGIDLAILAIKEASEKFSLPIKDIARELDNWEDFSVFNMDGDWWTFEGLEAKF